MTYIPEQLQHYKELENYLGPYIEIAEQEPLHHYPNHLDDFNESWIEEIFSIGREGFYELEGLRNIELIKNSSFREFLDKSKEISKIDTRENVKNIKLQGLALEGITGKKLHEISQLSQFIPIKMKENHLERVVDFASGKGHLAYILASEYKIPSLCIDSESEFQWSGYERNQKYLKDDAYLVEYMTHFLKPDSVFTPLQEDDFAMGLHTCGGLAKIHMDSFLKSNARMFLNFGCCYFKMNKDEFNISNYVKNNTFIHHPYALTLATRTHGDLSRIKFENKNRVKFFRFIIAFFLKENFNIPLDVVLKSSKKSSYKGRFADYARDQFERLHLKVNISDKALDEYFNKEENIRAVWEIQFCNTIRSFLGRPLELMLLYDRAFYLNESGVETKLISFFNENLSPRNIGLFGKKL